MRTGLTSQQSNILDADVKAEAVLFEVDIGNTGSVDYYWSTKAKSWGGQSYTFKIMDFSPLKILLPGVYSNMIQKNEIDVSVSFKDNIQGAYRASDFEGASLTIRLICKANLGLGGNAGQIDFGDTISLVSDEQEAEILAWTFKIKSSVATYQTMKWHCVDWFSEYVNESDYPLTRMVPDLFPGDIMADDNYCVPVLLGTGYFPLRWATKWLTVTFSDADTFTISGDYTSLFSAGYWLYADCGADGYKNCWVDSSSHADGTTTVNLTAGSDNLTANLTQVFVDFYVLGPDSPTYTIDRLRTPQEVGGDAEYLSTSYTFKQDTITGADGNDYKIVRAIIDDRDDDGTNDANGIWGLKDKTAHDVPFKLYRSDTYDIVNPANQAEHLMEAMGVPSGKINATAQATAAAVYTSRSFSLNIPLWQKQPSRNVLCKLFTVSGMVPIIRDDIYLKVLTKTSQLAIEKNLVIEDTFSISPRIYTQAHKDSGHVLWQKSTVPVGQGICNKNLVAAKSSTSNPADITIECEWVSDDTGVKAQKAGKLAIQRKLLEDKKIYFKAKAKILKLEPGDVITINPEDYGAEGSSYDCMIESMSISRDLTVTVEAVKYREALDDWDDLSASTITVGATTTASAHTPVYQGPRGATPDSGTKPNEITENVYIGSTGVLATNVDPATNGGFKATNSEIACYNTNGDLRFNVIYSGTDQGDVMAGDYDNSKGFKWDQSAGTFNVKGTVTATAGAIGGWSIAATTLSSANITIDSGNDRIVCNTITIDGGNNRIRSSNYVTGSAGVGFTLEPSLLEVGNIACRGIMRTAVFQKGVISAIGGNLLISMGSDILATDMTAQDSCTLTIAGNETFAVGDMLRIKDDSDDEWFEVTNIASAPTYTVTRDKGSDYGANSNPTWKAGATVVNYGASGDGLIHLTASETNAPYLSVMTHAGAPWTTLTTRARVGNLNGYLGYSSDIYGIGIGDTNNFIKYDPTNGIAIQINASNAITVKNGGDIKLESGAANPALFIFSGSAYDTVLGPAAYADGSVVNFMPAGSGDSGNVDLYIGKYEDNYFKSINLYATEGVGLGSYIDSDNHANVSVYGHADYSYCWAIVTYDGTTRSCKFYYDGTDCYLAPTGNKTWDLGLADQAWDDGYADDWNNVADFYHLDSMDDLGIINSIKGSGVIDKRSGLELIDDNTLPEFILTKDKKTGEILRDPDGKPYIPLKAGISLSWGAIRQLIKRIEELERKLQLKG